MEKILLAFDGSENAVKAAHKGIAIAQGLEAEMIILTVIGEESSPLYATEKKVYGDSPEQIVSMLNNTVPEKEAIEILKKAEAIFKESGLNIQYFVARGHVADLICTVAKEKEADLIVMGRRGLSSVKRFLLGSVSTNVVQASGTSVMLVYE